LAPIPPPRTTSALDEEHGYLTLAGGDDLELGQQVHVVPNHVCVVVNLFQELVGTRGAVESHLPVERGR
jgi:D-serine deaminase-like pyridoxal phosphate-dependent protein